MQKMMKMITIKLIRKVMSLALASFRWALSVDIEVVVRSGVDVLDPIPLSHGAMTGGRTTMLTVFWGGGGAGACAGGPHIIRRRLSKKLDHQ